MSLTERFGTRDLTYSRWHRPASIGRYLTTYDAERLTYIDLDGIEVCRRCYEPLALIELARDIGQRHKQTGIMATLAKRAQVPAYLVFYRVDGEDIGGFRMRPVWPPSHQPHSEVALSPREYAGFLISLRHSHTCAQQAVA